MQYVGIDFHRDSSFISEMDEDGTVAREFKLSNDRESLTDYVSGLVPDTKVAIEATCNWYYFYELVEGHDIDVTLAHPLKTKAIASARIMNDKISSATLAYLLRSDLLPAAYIPDRETRDTKEILRQRAFLVSMRTRLKNRVQAILSKNGLSCPYTDIFGKKSLRWLTALDLRPCYHQAIGCYARLADVFASEIKMVTETIESFAIENPQARLLDTHPGISYYSGLLITSEIGTIHRFPSHGQLCSFGGLVPSLHASGGKVRRGHITKQGSKWLRWILIECSKHAVNGSPHYEALYKRVCYKHGKGAARIAVARKMLKIIYYMLKRNEPFQERAKPMTTPASARGS
ncbi:MAG: IS110 family transposase [Gemmatimonadota bacterium]|nr:MAG: IS110 family transposase [Gemmatimonadota bacterium]